MSDHLVDMKMSKKQSTNEFAVSEDKDPRFPHGLSINLNDDSMKKLGFDELPVIGTEMIVVGVGKVTRASENRSQSGVDRDLQIQLERIEVEPLVKGSDHSSNETAVDARKT